jgi:uncharacterized BrkB/YihY/UPF0761 family membrane protein
VSCGFISSLTHPFPCHIVNLPLLFYIISSTPQFSALFCTSCYLYVPRHEPLRRRPQQPGVYFFTALFTYTAPFLPSPPLSGGSFPCHPRNADFPPS